MGVACTGGSRDDARRLADSLRLPLLSALPAGKPGDIAIRCDADGAAFKLLGPRSPGPVPVTFDDPALRQRRRGGHNELLGRAVGWRDQRAPRILDATAGYGRDAFILADLGCDVLLCERHPVMAALLARAIERARESEDPWLCHVAQRLHFAAGDARGLALAELGAVDVIYLDPMFPEQRRGLPSKEMQVLAALLAADGGAADDEASAAEYGELLAWARQQAVGRVVVKRPRRAPPLGGAPPSHVLSGRAVRFDVYVLRAIASNHLSETP